MRLVTTAAVVAFLAVAICATNPARSAKPVAPLAHTYSIVARDPETGALGVAVQSHWFQVGVLVTWAEAGVGAVATQSFVEPAYGPKGLALMKSGKTAQVALDELLAADPQKDVRQVAFVDAQGNAAGWTGSKCIQAAGNLTAKGYSVQANLMDKASVWPAMAKAYEASAGKPFAERLILALEAAEKEGGDIRGRQSAALLIVKPVASGDPWRDKLVDIRVDESAEPLKELRRIYTLHLAYELMNAGDGAVAENKMEEALVAYSKAAKLAPQIVELPFWQAVQLFVVGREDEALVIFRTVFQKEPRWARLVPRLPASGLLPDDPAKIKKILSVAPGKHSTK